MNPSRHEITRFIEALSLLYLARLMLWVLPFRWCMKLIRQRGSQGRVPAKDELQAIKQAIRRANKRAFWKNTCLVESFAARWMLRRRGIRSKIYIGVKPDQKTKIAAHAWVISHGNEVVARSGDYKILMEG